MQKELKNISKINTKANSKIGNKANKNINIINKGITLIELLMVSFLLLLILSGIFIIINMIQQNYKQVDIKSQILEKTNIFIMQIEKDIRSASKPNELTNSVVVYSSPGDVPEGEKINIYTYNEATGKYSRIAYRLLPSDTSKLQRGWIECTTSIPDKNVKNPRYGEIPDDPEDYKSGEGGKWKTVLDDILLEIDGEDIEIFEDITIYTHSEKRSIKLNLFINDEVSPLKNPITINKTLTSRTKVIP